MHDPLYDRVEAGKAVLAFEDAGTGAAAVARGLAALRTQLEPPAPDPQSVAARNRYRLNRAQRRAADRQEHA